MKLYRVLAVILAMLMIGCVMVACDKEPEAVPTSVKVAFTIKAGPGDKAEVLEQDIEYTYTYGKVGDKEPTITEILIDFCEVYELTLEFEDETQQVITKIDSKSAGKGEFWTYALNGENDLKNPMYIQTVKEGDIIVVYLDSIH